MLEQHWITTQGWVEEAGAQGAVEQQHGDCAAQYWNSQQKQERCDQHRPDEQRHTMQGHTRRTHVQNGGNEVRSTKDRASTRYVERKNRVGHAVDVDCVAITA